MKRNDLRAISLGLLVIAATVVAVWLANRGPDAARAEDPRPIAPNIVQPGAPGASSSTLAPDDLGRVETIAPTQADVAFVQGMIHHHQQALVMADYVPSRGSGADLKVLARRLRVGQDGEIKQMQAWLENNNASAHAGGHEPAQLMPGMLTAAELARLEAARGTAFDRLFLQYMIKHHQGALTMIGRLYAADGGAQSELDLLIRHIDTDQTTEITRMRQLLR
jgi:uncharacterized protein (DUF305 family)